jgi:hypothetical protein
MGVAMADCMGAVQGNVIDEPTAPQNLELGQIDLAAIEDPQKIWEPDPGQCSDSAANGSERRPEPLGF